MTYHKICQHAPKSMLDGAFECVASMSYYNQHLIDKEAIDRLLYDNLLHSKEHTQLILKAHYIAASFGCIENGENLEYYLCVRGYL